MFPQQNTYIMPEDSFLYQKDQSSAPAISERRGRRHIKYTLRHSQFVRYIISGKENAIDTPWQTNEQLHEH